MKVNKQIHSVAVETKKISFVFIFLKISSLRFFSEMRGKVFLMLVGVMLSLLLSTYFIFASFGRQTKKEKVGPVYLMNQKKAVIECFIF